MSKVANQRTVEVNKEICNKSNNYATINLDALEKASLDLNGVAFKLWMFFARNQQGYNVDMWINNLEKFGIPKGGSYNRAWEELEKKGYIVLTKGKTIYAFHEVPLVTKMVINDTDNSLVTKTELDSYQNGKRIVTKTEPIVTKMVRENNTYNTNNNTNNNTDNIEKDISLTLASTDNNVSEPVVDDEPIVEIFNKDSKLDIVPKTNSDLVDYLLAQYNISATHIKSKFAFNDEKIILSMFKDSTYTKKLDWMDKQNTYKDDFHKFNAHCSFMLKHYESEVAEWKSIEESRKREDARNLELANDMNDFYENELGIVQGGTIQEYNSYQDKRNMVVNGNDEDEIDLPF